MSETIVKLVQPSEVYEHERRADMVAALEGYLERARRGEFMGLAIALTLQPAMGGGVSTAWVSGKGSDQITLAGACGYLQHRLTADWADMPNLDQDDPAG